MPKKLTYNDVKEFIESKGCKLISNEYKNNKTKLEIECVCGEYFYVSFDAFKRKQNKCQKCNNHVLTNLDEVRRYIESKGCKLISNEYKNSRTKLEIECNCGEHFEVSFAKFKDRNKQQCNKCSNNYKPTYEEVKKEIESHGVKLISKEYNSALEKLELECSCGEHYHVSLNHFRYYERYQCPKCNCGFAKRNLTFEEVKEEIESHGVKLVSKEYKNNKQVLELECSCGKHFHCNFNDFLTHERYECQDCISSFSKGELKIREVLESLNIHFLEQTKFNDLKDSQNLSFDFYVINDEYEMLIEFDGAWHFKKHWADIDGKVFKIQKKHDKMKDAYCKKHDIPILRINYLEYDMIEEILEKELAYLKD